MLDFILCWGTCIALLIYLYKSTPTRKGTQELYPNEYGIKSNKSNKGSFSEKVYLFGKGIIEEIRSQKDLYYKK